MQEIGKFDVKIIVIPNGLKNTWHLQFIKIWFLLIKNLSDNDIKHLSQEFSGNLLELVKQKSVHLYEYIDSFKKFSDKQLPDRFKFFSSLRDERERLFKCY